MRRNIHDKAIDKGWDNWMVWMQQPKAKRRVKKTFRFSEEEAEAISFNAKAFGMSENEFVMNAVAFFSFLQREMIASYIECTKRNRI